jgi:hypothetical protein
MIADRAGKPGIARSEADRLRRVGWGFQLMGRALDLRNCRKGAIDNYKYSTTQRCRAIKEGYELTESLGENMDWVRQWCHENGEDIGCSCPE